MIIVLELPQEWIQDCRKGWDHLRLDFFFGVGVCWCLLVFVGVVVVVVVVVCCWCCCCCCCCCCFSLLLLLLFLLGGGGDPPLYAFYCSPLPQPARSCIDSPSGDMIFSSSVNSYFAFCVQFASLQPFRSKCCNTFSCYMILRMHDSIFHFSIKVIKRVKRPASALAMPN